MSIYKTPLRYPGGKQKLWPFIAEILESSELRHGHYVEPYAGGAGVAMELLIRRIVSRVHLNDSCPAVFAFWHSILNEPEKFCRKISRASLTVDYWKKQREVLKSKEGADIFDLGYAMFILNRCNRSGILSAGVIGGLEQKGNWKMDARFSRKDLIRRIEIIAPFKRSVRIRNLDAERFLTQYIRRLPEKTLVYCDPPYFKKADRLYPNHYSPDDHARVAKIIQSVSLPWIVSYDANETILSYYDRFRTIQYKLQYNAGRVYKGSELFAFSNAITIPPQSSVRTINDALVSQWRG